MRRATVRAFSSAIVFTFASSIHYACAQRSLCSAAPPSALAYTLTAAKTTVKSGDDVRVKLTVKNTLEYRIPMWVENTPDPGGLVYHFKVTQEGGKSTPEEHFTKALRGIQDPRYMSSETPINRGGGCVDLLPGETRMFEMNVGRLYKISDPGVYNIVLVQSGKGGTQEPLSNEVTIDVNPK